MKCYSSDPTDIAISVKRLNKTVIEIRNYIVENIKEQFECGVRCQNLLKSSNGSRTAEPASVSVSAPAVAI